MPVIRIVPTAQFQPHVKKSLRENPAEKPAKEAPGSPVKDAAGNPAKDAAGNPAKDAAGNSAGTVVDDVNDLESVLQALRDQIEGASYPSVSGRNCN